LAISRPSLREALQKLSSKGLLSTHRAGGTYVSDSLEGTAAYYTALR
jgi:DNA-binding FadR family transcriptional regulator